MHIALCGPVTPALLQPLLDDQVDEKGYPFPLLAVLAHEYVRLGHRVSVISTAPDISVTQRYGGPHADLWLVPSRPRPRDRALDLFRLERRGIAAALREVEPDVIHAHWTYEFAAAALSVDRRRTLVTAHDAPLTILHYMPDPYRALRAVLAVWVRIRLTAVTAISPYLSHRLRRELFFVRQIEVIPNPVSPPPAHSGVVDGDDRPLVLEVSDGSRRKNVRELLRAFAIVLEAHPQAQLRLIGNGLEPAGSLSRWARARELSNNVVFLGPLPKSEVEAQMRECRVLAHSSREESHGLVLVEAMSSGMLVVASSRAGATYWTTFHGQGGILSPTARAADLARSISRALDSPRRNQQEQTELNQLINRRHAPTVVAKSYERALEALIRSRPL